MAPFVDALVLAGRRAEAVPLFEKLLEVRNDVGLLSEEYDPEGKRLLVRPEYDEVVTRDIERWFDRCASLSFANYAVPGEGWRGEER